MLILGIESSCDETAAAVVEDGRKKLSDVVASQVEEHKLYGGVVPEIASRRHAEAISGVVRRALDEAGVSLAQIGAVAVTHAPGLIGALLVGVNFAKGLAFSTGLPLVPTHHLRCTYCRQLSGASRFKAAVSLPCGVGRSHPPRAGGGATPLFTLIGRTRDDAAGECFDKAARAMGLPYPGGIHLDRLAGGGDPAAFAFPRPHVEGSEWDFSFSGLKTAVINRLHQAEQKGETLPLPDLAASFQYTVADILCDHTLRAAQAAGSDTVVLAGGVSANSGLRALMEERCKKLGLALYMPPLSLCGDNGAMVAAQGYYEYCSGNIAGLELNAAPTLPIEYR